MRHRYVVTVKQVMLAIVIKWCRYEWGFQRTAIQCSKEKKTEKLLSKKKTLDRKL